MTDSTNRTGNRSNNWAGNSGGNHSRTGNSVGENRTSDGVGNRCGNNVREDGLAIVGDLGDVSIDVVGVVVDMLDPAIRQTDRVVALSGGSAIVRLLSVETGSGVVVSHGVLVVVGGRLGQVTRIITSDSVSYGVGNHRVGHDTVSNRVGNNRVGHGVGNGMSHDRMGYGVTHHSVTHEAMRQKLGAGRSHSQESRTDECLGDGMLYHS